MDLSGLTPPAYGLPVLIPERYGCAGTLVRNGVNGFLFDPLDAGGLAKLMLKVSNGEVGLAAMGQASREIISYWTPEAFAESLVRAAECALSQPKPYATVLERLLLWTAVRLQGKLRSGESLEPDEAPTPRGGAPD